MRTTTSTKYSLFAGAEQHGSAHGTGVWKSCLSDFLESSRNCRVSGEETGHREKKRKNANLSTAAQSPEQKRERKFLNPKGKLKVEKLISQSKVLFFFFF